MNRTYEQGVKDGCNLYYLNKGMSPNSINIYGKTLDELSKIIYEHELKQLQWTEEEARKIKARKMTREEAVKKCYGINYPEAFIQALEALGLIKFEEEKPEYLKIQDIDGDIQSININNAISALENRGYTVKKNG